MDYFILPFCTLFWLVQAFSAVPLSWFNGKEIVAKFSPKMMQGRLYRIELAYH